MKRGFALAAIFAGAVTAAGQAGAAECNGRAFGGDYIVQPYPSLMPLIPEHLNRSGELVRSVETYPVFTVVTPANPAMGCEEFMRRMYGTGQVKKISPNWADTMEKLGRPQP
jgi:hypothetical protein